MTDVAPGTPPACPICGGADTQRRFPVTAPRGLDGVGPEAFRPSADSYGRSAGTVYRCRSCGHGFIPEFHAANDLSAGYTEAADPVSLREEAGQVETARRDLASIERLVPHGRVADIGCWTGSFLVAARERGWTVEGIEHSRWAVTRARERGLDVRRAEVAFHGWEPTSFDLVAMRDVLEHLEDPSGAVAAAAEVLHPGGVLFATVPDAGSVVARALGRRWWSVLHMHLHHFTRASMRLLLERNGFAVHSMRTHPKVFTARYYGERLGGYAAWMERVAVGSLERLAVADRLVAPDLHDRLAVIATRRP